MVRAVPAALPTMPMEMEMKGAKTGLEIGLWMSWQWHGIIARLVRERLRGGHNLNMNYDQEKHVATDSYVEKTIPSLKLNHFVVSPLLKMMAANDRTLPNLDRLLQQVTYLFERSKVNLGTKRGDRIYQEGWAIRRLCGVAKKLLYRPSLPKDQGGVYHEKCI